MTLELDAENIDHKDRKESRDNHRVNISDDATGPTTKKATGKSFSSRLLWPVRRILFSSLTRRIVILNMTALAVLLGAILYVNQFREGLIDARIESLLTQGRIIAGAIAGSATASPDAITIDPEKLLELKAGESLRPQLDPLDNFSYPISPEQIAPVLRLLIKPTQTRARIYDPDGILILDSRFLYDAGRIQQFDLPPVTGARQSKESGWTQRIGQVLNFLLGERNYPLYRDFAGPGTEYPEVQTALTGTPRSIVRQTDKGRLTVSVAVPVQRFRAVFGVLLLSTEGDDIDRIILEERIEILRTFFIAGIVLSVLSALLASTIANPLRKLSEAAVRVKQGIKSRVAIPNLSHRNDEIGELSVSLSDMTNSLYSRIEAIESFAADVSHELKNPLTSLRSAVETLPLAKTDNAKQRLMSVIQHDVQRLDRLITDISDASRLDADLVREAAHPLNLEELVSQIVAAANAVKRKNKSTKVELSVETRKGKRKDYHVMGQEVRLGQVINNLIDNAISFVPEKDGRVSLSLSGDADQITLSVEDNGPGIQAEKIERIFERFYTDRSANDGFGQNSGLGLSISRQIVEAHGGTIGAVNLTPPRTGARFTVTFPAGGS